MKTRRRPLWLAVLFSGIIGSIFWDSPDLLSAAPRGVLKEAIHWSISADWFDPAITGHYMSTFPGYLFHDALLKPMPEGTYTPCLAESWKISPDAKVYEFNLRKGVKFHNGDNMTAEDVIFSFWRYKGRKLNSFTARRRRWKPLIPIWSAFISKNPFRIFWIIICPDQPRLAGSCPKSMWKKWGMPVLKRHPIGCGPYKFVEFVPGVKLVGEAFEEYWRKVSQHQENGVLYHF